MCEQYNGRRRRLTTFSARSARRMSQFHLILAIPLISAALDGTTVYCNAVYRNGTVHASHHTHATTILLH